jgi:hypothetical protein
MLGFETRLLQRQLQLQLAHLGLKRLDRRIDAERLLVLRENWRRWYFVPRWRQTCPSLRQSK